MWFGQNLILPQLFPQPQQSQIDTFKPGSNKGTPWELAWWHQSTRLTPQSWFWSVLYTLSVQLKEWLFSIGNKENSWSLLGDNIPGFSSAAHDNATEVPNSFISTTLFLHLSKCTDRGWKMATLIQHGWSAGLGPCHWRNTRRYDTQWILQAF